MTHFKTEKGIILYYEYINMENNEYVPITDYKKTPNKYEHLSPRTYARII